MFIIILGIVYIQQLNVTTINEETKNGNRTWLERDEHDKQFNNAFQKWTEKLYEQSKELIHERKALNLQSLQIKNITLLCYVIYIIILLYYDYITRNLVLYAVPIRYYL